MVVIRIIAIIVPHLHISLGSIRDADADMPGPEGKEHMDMRA
jgi:hypothetical protein